MVDEQLDRMAFALPAVCTMIHRGWHRPRIQTASTIVSFRLLALCNCCKDIKTKLLLKAWSFCRLWRNLLWIIWHPPNLAIEFIIHRDKIIRIKKINNKKQMTQSSWQRTKNVLNIIHNMRTWNVRKKDQLKTHKNKKQQKLGDEEK